MPDIHPAGFLQRVMPTGGATEYRRPTSDPRDVLRTAATRLMPQLAEMRRAFGLTQEQVAERMQTSRGYISLIETRRKDPRLSSVLRYADAIGVRVDIEITQTEGAQP